MGTALEGSVEFENRRLERITEGTIEREPGTPSWRIHFVTPGLLNDQDVILIWEGEANARGQMTLQTTIQVFNGRKIELDTPRSYRRISRD